MTIGCFAQSQPAYERDYAIVAVDVIRATTTAVTAVALGRRCFPVPSLEAAWELAARLPQPLLAGELNGDMPAGFEINNSPFALLERADLFRPLLLLSTSGTRLISHYGTLHKTYVACLRNYSVQAAYLSEHCERVALIGAGSQGEFRKEDLLCCAHMAQLLLDRGYQPREEETAALIREWSRVSFAEIETGKSARYLRESQQQHDLDFVLTHIDDLRHVYQFCQGEVVQIL